jgi:hypothetical protein
MRLPPPDEPMVWNGPLHAPVLRPVFAEEPGIRWSRKNQTVRAFRPSGIPNQPVDHSLLKSNLVYNYKPEIEGNGSRPDEESPERGSRGGRRGRERERTNDRRRGRERGRSQPRQEPQSGGSGPSAPALHEQGTSTAVVDEDSIGNIRMPGEPPAPLGQLGGPVFQEEGDIDDDIGNRLDGPPTSGHVGLNGDGFLTHQRKGPGGQSRGGGGGSGSGSGSGSGGNRRRGRKRGRRGGGGGPNRGSPPRGQHGNL